MQLVASGGGVRNVRKVKSGGECTMTDAVAVFLICLGYYLLGAAVVSLPYLLYLILKELLGR